METNFYSPTVQIMTCRIGELGKWWTRQDFRAPYWRLYWNAAPGAAVIWNGHATALGPTRLVAIPPETPFLARCTQPVSQLYIHFLASEPYDAVRPDIYAFPADGELGRLARVLHDMPAADDSCRHRSMLSLTLVYAALAHVPDQALEPAPSDPRVVRVLAAMDASLQNPLSNDHLAELAGMSRNAFIRLFGAAMGMTPQACYTRKRIDRTCMLLHFSQMKLEQIAEAAGFCDRYHFSRTFKRLRGIGPAAFRRQVAIAK